MDLEALQRIKHWHTTHAAQHPVECHAWDAMLTLWLVGWVGWIPAFAFDALWAAPLLAVMMSAPTMYVSYRAKAHREKRLRCDWLVAR